MNPDPATIDEPVRALVVGGSVGIGRAVADAWAAAGADVTVASRSEPTGPGAQALTWRPLDLTDPGATRAALAAFADGPGGPVVATCFSATDYGARRAPLGEVEESEWRRQVDVNLHGAWLTLRCLLPALRRTGQGVFVGVSSEVVHNAGPGRSGYAATKAAAASLLASVGQEEGGGVTVVQMMPAGMVDSPGIRRRRPDGFDYSGYMTPESFAPLATELLRGRGTDLDGAELVVDASGAWRPVGEAGPVSQSRTADREVAA